MKIKNKTILDFAAVRLGDRKLPVKVAFALTVNADAIEGALKAYNKQRDELINKYAKKDKKGELVIREDGTYDIKDVEGWNNDITELLESEAEINITTIKMKDLMKCDDEAFDSFSVAEMALMRFMIEG